MSSNDVRSIAIDLMPYLQAHLHTLSSTPTGVSLQQFITTLRHYVPEHECDDHRLQAVFAAVDCDSVGEITWKDFTTFSVDAITTQRNQVDMYVQPFRTYPSYMMPPKRPMGCFRSRVVSFATGPRVLFQTRDKQMIDFDVAALTYTPITVPYEVNVQSFTIIPALNQLVIASAGPEVFSTDRRSGDTQRAQCNESQTYLDWWERTHNLVTGARNGDICFWEMRVNSLMQHSARIPTLKSQLHIHSAHVTDLAFLENTAVISASFDGSVAVVDPVKSIVTNMTKPLPTERPVTCMALCRDYSLVLCGGMTVVPTLHMVIGNKGNNKPFVLQDPLEPHSKFIVGVCSFPWGCQVGSLDAGGVMKLWDIRTCRCLQTLQLNDITTINKKKQTWTSLCMAREDMLVAGSDYDMFFCVPEENHEIRSQTDEGPILGISVNEPMDLVVTICKRTVRTWSLKSGKAVNAFTGCTPDTITAHILDPLGRKVFVGCEDGSVVVVSIETGAAMATFNHLHREEVYALCLLVKSNLLISSGGDSTLIVSSSLVLGSDYDRDMKRLRVELRTNITSLVSLGNDKSIVGLTNIGEVFVYDVGMYVHMKLNFFCIPKQPVQLRMCDGLNVRDTVRCTSCLQAYGSFIFVGDSRGWVTVWNIKDIRSAVESFLLTMTREVVPSVTAMKLVPLHEGTKLVLYVGDDQGYLSVFDVSDLVLQGKLGSSHLTSRIESSKDSIMSICCAVQSRLVLVGTVAGRATVRNPSGEEIALFDRSHECPYPSDLTELRLPWPFHEADDSEGSEDVEVENEDSFHASELTPRSKRREALRVKVARLTSGKSPQTENKVNRGNTSTQHRVHMVESHPIVRAKRDHHEKVLSSLLSLNTFNTTVESDAPLEPLQPQGRRVRGSIVHSTDIIPSFFEEQEMRSREKPPLVIPEVSRRTVKPPTMDLLSKVKKQSLNVEGLKEVTRRVQEMFLPRPSSNTRSNSSASRPQSRDVKRGVIPMSCLRPMSAMDVHRPMITNPYTFPSKATEQSLLTRKLSEETISNSIEMKVPVWMRKKTSMLVKELLEYQNGMPHAEDPQ
eukprot:PhF_6_TR29369/c0_g1_i1/m.43230